jgi:hypothetical protein
VPDLARTSFASIYLARKAAVNLLVERNCGGGDSFSNETILRNEGPLDYVVITKTGRIDTNGLADGSITDAPY